MSTCQMPPVPHSQGLMMLLAPVLGTMISLVAATIYILFLLEEKHVSRTHTVVGALCAGIIRACCCCGISDSRHPMLSLFASVERLHCITSLLPATVDIIGMCHLLHPYSWLHMQQTPVFRILVCEGSLPFSMPRHLWCFATRTLQLKPVEWRRCMRCGL